MTRETRWFVLMACLLAALYVANRIGSQTAGTVLLIAFALVFLAHIRVADTSTRIRGPIWLRRAQWGAAGGMLLLASCSTGSSSRRPSTSPRSGPRTSP
jgi:hypothetical protein